MMDGLTVLIVLVCLASLTWWLLAASQLRKLLRRTVPAAPGKRPGISFFKAFPACHCDKEAAIWQQSVKSLLPHLIADDEFIVGIHVEDRERFSAWGESLQSECGEACVRLVFDTPPTRHINQKVNWMHRLAEEASRPLWFWSDADIELPDNFGAALHADAARLDQCGMVTYAYRIVDAGSAWGLLDAAFVNTTMLPGLALLRNKPDLCFGLGAGMLFRADEFREKIEWAELGRQLTDDNFMGKAMRPVQMGSVTLTTRMGNATPRTALSHYYRWEKTIRWTEPLAYFCQLLVQPIAFTLLGLCLLPLKTALPLFLVFLVAETAYLLSAFHMVGMPRSRQLLAAPLVPLFRFGVWLAVWLPFGVWWRGKYWSKAQYHEGEADS